MALRAESRNNDGAYLAHPKVGGNVLDLVEGMDALHCRDHAVWGEQVLRQRDEVGDLGESARNDEIELPVSAPGFDPLAHGLRVVQLELRDRVREKGGFLVVALEQDHARFGPRDRDWNSRKP